MGGNWNGVFADPGTSMAIVLQQQLDELERNYLTLESYYKQVTQNRDDWMAASNRRKEEIVVLNDRIANLEAEIDQTRKKLQEKDKLFNTLLPRAMINQEKDKFHSIHIEILEQMFGQLAENFNIPLSDVQMELKRALQKAQSDYLSKNGGTPQGGKVRAQDVFSPSPR